MAKPTFESKFTLPTLGAGTFEDSGGGKMCINFRDNELPGGQPNAFIAYRFFDQGSNGEVMFLGEHVDHIMRRMGLGKMMLEGFFSGEIFEGTPMEGVRIRDTTAIIHKPGLALLLENTGFEPTNQPNSIPMYVRKNSTHVDRVPQLRIKKRELEAYMKALESRAAKTTSDDGRHVFYVRETSHNVRSGWTPVTMHTRWKHPEGSK